MPTTHTDAGSLARAAARPPGRGWLLTGGAMLVLAIGLRLWTPSDDPARTLCVFRRLTHRDCATCGMTRAMALLVRGDVRGSFARHPLAPPVAAEAALAWGLVPIARRRGWSFPPPWRDRVLLANAAAFLGLWIGRLLAP